MRGDIMSAAEVREYSDRIREMRWERQKERAAQRQAAAARRAAFVRSTRASAALLLRTKRRA